jgi:hypothetical protein
MPNSCEDVARLYECSGTYVSYKLPSQSLGETPIFPAARQRARLRKYVCDQCDRRSYTAIRGAIQRINSRIVQDAGKTGNTTEAEMKAWLDRAMERADTADTFDEDPGTVDGGRKRFKSRSKSLRAKSRKTRSPKRREKKH